MSRTQRRFGAFGAGSYRAGRKKQPRGDSRPAGYLVDTIAVSGVVTPLRAKETRLLGMRPLPQGLMVGRGVLGMRSRSDSWWWVKTQSLYSLDPCGRLDGRSLVSFEAAF